MYQFKEQLNLGNFFKFDKMNVKNKRWARLPKASKSIYPVIGVHCNSVGIAFPSELTIGILSGRTPKTVREGIAGLMHYPGFTIDRYVTSHGQRAIKYKIDVLPDKKGRFFPFYKCAVEGGNWRQLRPGAQALYPVIKTFSYFNSEEYCDRENLDYGYDMQEMIENGDFQQRKYDFCDADIDVLADYSGIGINTAERALDELEAVYLIEKTDTINETDTWKVFRVPTHSYKADWLNKNINKITH